MRWLVGWERDNNSADLVFDLPAHHAAGWIKGCVGGPPGSHLRARPFHLARSPPTGSESPPPRGGRRREQSASAKPWSCARDEVRYIPPAPYHRVGSRRKSWSYSRWWWSRSP